MMRTSIATALILAATAVACGDDRPTPDDRGGGGMDSGVRDQGPNPPGDTGVGEMDAGDAGTTTEDTGTMMTMDSGTPSNNLGGRLNIGTGVAFSSSTYCREAPGLPVSECLSAEVMGCDGVADVSVYLKVSTPQGALRGTVVLGTGGPGTAFYEQFAGMTVPQEHILVPLYNAGYRIVQRAWELPGWNQGPGGPMKVACRYPTLMKALHDRYTDAPFCATGQSGGAGEISYGLAHYGLESLMKAVVITAGPPFGRLDHGCLGENDPSWQMECNDIAVCGQPLCVFTGMPGGYFIDDMYADGTASCVMHNEAMRQTFLNDSVLNPLADLHYPTVDTRFVFGMQDCSEAMPLGYVYADAVMQPKQIVYVPGPHIIQMDPDGSDGIFNQINDACH